MKNHGRFFSWLIVFAIILGVSGVSFANSNVEAVPGEYVVKLRGNVGMFSAASMANMVDGEIKSYLTKDAKTVVIRKSMLIQSHVALSELKKNPMIEIAEPNYIYRPVLVPNDARFDDLWGMVNNQKVGGADIDADLAWDITTGSSDIVVAVIDSGVDYGHEDLKNNMWVNEAEKNGQPGVDDDGNGFIDDIYGYDFANNDGDPMDDNDHGSHCAGTIGGEGDNGIGVTGVNWQVRIMALKFLTASGGGTLEAAIKSIDYAVQMGANVLSNSWGGGGYSENLKQAIQRAEQAGVLFVAAAGNEARNNDSTASYPANYEVDNVISVAAIDNNGQLANFSNYGKSKVHIAAPGVDILSSIPGGYEEFSGTSMATPHVSGVAALLLAHEPNLSYKEVKERLLATAVPLNSLKNKVSTGAVVNAYNALTNTLPPPDDNDPAQWPMQEESLSSAHPYANNTKQTYTLTVPGAEKVSVHFARFDLENRYDKVVFKDLAGNEYGSMTGLADDSFSPVVEGDTVVMEFSSDFSVTRYGFDVDGVAYKGQTELEWRSREEFVSTAHPYANLIRKQYVFQESGAQEIKVYFARFETEKKYDKVTFKDSSGQVLAVWDGVHDGEFSPTAQGDTLIVEFYSDWSITRYGFDVESVHYK